MAVNRVHPEAERTYYGPVTAGKLSGAPETIGQLPCALLTNADTNDGNKATVQMDGIWSMSVNAEAGAIAIGDIIYYDEADVTTKLNNTAGGNVRWGYALEAIGNGLTATIKVKCGY